MKHARLAISPAGFEHKASDMKQYIAKHKLIDIIYITKDRVPLPDAQLTDDEQKLKMATLVRPWRKLPRQVNSSRAENFCLHSA